MDEVSKSTSSMQVTCWIGIADMIVSFDGLRFESSASATMDCTGSKWTDG
jgi:hypothetical protein